MTEQEIRERLVHIGFGETDIPNVMRDVGAVIAGKVFVTYLQTLPEQEQAHIKALEQDDLLRYLKEHPGSTPSISQEQFDAILEETWEDYFKSVR
ncbi:MAG TPA: hypothetical protein VMU13_02015 [Candidatus Paceibacterota bacterium]|nr:hypothetical protein [Candidatus Paceibacterota bacterium]